MKAALRFVGLYLVVSLIAGASALLWSWPWHPTTVVGWLLLVACALPVTAAGEWLAQVIFDNRFAARLGSTPKPGAVSWTRVAYGVAVFTAILAICFALAGWSK